MTPAEAGRILGISPKADMEQIKKQYRRLMHQFHPDVSGFSNTGYQYTAQEINLAYEVLKKGFADFQEDIFSGAEKKAASKNLHWDAPLNQHAWTEREILHYAEDYEGNVIGNFTIARGKYLWTEEEDFPLFLLSISRCAKALLDEAEDRLVRQEVPARLNQTLPRSQVLADLVYLLAQQFIDSTGLLEQLAKKKTADSSGNPVFYLPAMLEAAPGLLPPEDGCPLYPARLSRHRLYLKDASGRELGYLSFPDDRLYYVIIPLFEQRRVQVQIRTAGTQETASRPGKPQGSRKKKDAGRYRHLHLWIRFSAESGSSLPENLNLQIERLLAEYRQAL